MKIRAMQTSDLEQIMVLENELYKTPWNQAFYEQDLANKFSHLFVLEKAGKIVGYAGIWIVSDDATITKVSIAKNEQGQGLSKLLLNQLIELAKQSKCQQISLEVRIHNKVAHSLYLQSGFKEVSLRRNYYDDGEDAILMVKKIEG